MTLSRPTRRILGPDTRTGADVALSTQDPVIVTGAAPARLWHMARHLDNLFSWRPMVRIDPHDPARDLTPAELRDAFADLPECAADGYGALIIDPPPLVYGGPHHQIIAALRDRDGEAPVIIAAPTPPAAEVLRGTVVTGAPDVLGADHRSHPLSTWQVWHGPQLRGTVAVHLPRESA